MQLFSSCLNYIYAIFEDLSELQIREGIEDNSKMTVLISHQKTYVVTPHLNRHSKTVLMIGHNIHFKEYGKLSLNYPCYPFLHGAQYMLFF